MLLDGGVVCRSRSGVGWAPYRSRLRASKLSGIRLDTATVQIQVVLNRLGCTGDIELSIILVDNQRGVSDQRVTDVSGFYVLGTVIEVEPPEIVFDDPNNDQLLIVAIIVPRQWRSEVIGSDLVLVEIRGDYLVCMLASEHRGDWLTVELGTEDAVV